MAVVGRVSVVDRMAAAGRMAAVGKVTAVDRIAAVGRETAVDRLAVVGMKAVLGNIADCLPLDIPNYRVAAIWNAFEIVDAVAGNSRMAIADCTSKDSYSGE